jgi:hypothetical protein
MNGEQRSILSVRGKRRVRVLTYAILASTAIALLWQATSSIAHMMLVK